MVLFEFVVSFVVAFYLTSWLLLRHPVLSQKSALASRIRNVVQIAHRGCRCEGIPENTIAAFKHGMAAGCDMIELDVQLTKDGKVVVFHDYTLARMCGPEHTQKLSQLNYDQLPVLAPADAKQRHTSDQLLASAAGEDAVSKIVDEHFRIPLFEQVLDAVGDEICMIVEFKQNDQSLLKQVHDMLTTHNRTTHGNTVWFSLSVQTNHALRKFDPTIPTISSISEMLWVMVYYTLGLLPFVKIQSHIVGFPCDEISLARIQNSLPSLPSLLTRLLHLLIGGHPSTAVLLPKLSHHLRMRGHPVWYLGINSHRELRAAVRAGASGLLTDAPVWLAMQKDDVAKVNRVFG